MRLELTGISKRFGATSALSEVGFDVAQGERLAVLGENGAGKSTLMKILVGVHQADAGAMRLNGSAYAPASPGEALAAGVSIVYQEPSFFAHLSVLENFFVGRAPTDAAGNLAWARMRQQATAAFTQLDLKPELLGRAMGTLSLAEQQMVLIARAVDIKCQVLILDEPTSILTANEADRLFAIVERLAAHNVTTLYITHRFGEIPRVADRVVILRDGNLVADLPADEATHDIIVARMSGREVTRVTRRSTRAAGEALLRLDQLTRAGEYADIDLDVARGEIVGLYGLIGSGRTEIALTVFGDRAPQSGRMSLSGEPYRPASPRAAVAQGVAYLPEDRKTQGNFGHLSTGQNLASASLRSESTRWGILRRKALRGLVDRGIKALRIKAPSPDFPILGLSGGHQQKTLFARWLATDPQLLLLDEPTRGIDVGTKAELHTEIMRLADAGVGILIISSELPELFAVADRIEVLREGRIVASLVGEEITEDRVLRATLGVGEEGESA
ncbi:MAG: sugar ABC transporter ATP-binding protein [Arachnia sp.]